MKHLLTNFDFTTQTIAEMKALFASLPGDLCFDSLPGNSEDVNLIQLHVVGSPSTDMRIDHAKMIARAFGGEWSKIGENWEGSRPYSGHPLGRQKLFIHGVIEGEKREAIDLT